MEATLNDLKLELWLRRRNEGKITWTTKNNDKIAIKDMSTTHIQNAINLLEQQQEVMEHQGDYDPVFYY